VISPAIVGYLVQRNPTAAADLDTRIFEIIDTRGGDFDGPEETLHSGEVVHSWPVSPVRIYYQRQSNVLWVLRVYHQSRLPIVG